MLQQSNASKFKKTMCEILLNNLEKRYKVTDDMVVAALLDPTLQHMNAVSEWIQKNRYESKTEFLFSKFIEDDEVENEEPDLVST